MQDLQRHNGSSGDDGMVRAARGEADALLAAVMTATMASPGGSKGPALDSDSLPGYQLLGEVHRGGQGVVYQAIHKATKRKVAVKVMREGPFASDRERARFDREVEILGRLSHPNIVTIHDRGAVAGNAYFVMDYVSGQPLDVYMASGHRSIPDTLRLFARICEAVDVAHLNGIIHRDLKPSNIRIDAAGEPHILDFGLARVIDGDSFQNPKSKIQNLTVSGQFVGSLPWASPEQVEGVSERIDLRTDVYSLGVILYGMLTRRFPYEVVGHVHQVMRNILQADPVRPRTIRREVDDEVETIVLKCLQKLRERRYQTAGEVARDVRRYLAGEPIEAKRDSAWYFLKKSLSRRRVPVAAAAAVLLAAMSTGLIYSRRLAAAEEARRAAVNAHIAAERQALADQEKWLQDREDLTFLVGRVAAGQPVREEELQTAEELLASLGERLRRGKLNPAAVEDLARLLLDVEVRGRRLTAVGIEPMLSVVVGTRPDFWAPGMVQVVRVSTQLDGDVASTPTYAELAGGHGSSSTMHPISAGELCKTNGEHVLTGTLTVRFHERTQGVDGGGVYAHGLSTEPPAERPILAECELPIPPFRFTVAEGIDIPLAITDPALAAVTRNQIEFKALTWHPARTVAGFVTVGSPTWRLRVRWGRPFAPIAWDLQLRDADGRVLAAAPLVVDSDGRPALGSWGGGPAEDGQMEFMITLAAASDLPLDADGLPVVVEPVTVTLEASREAALQVPEVDAYLAFEMSAVVPVSLRP